MVDDGAEGEAVAERRGQVADVDVRVGRRDALAPAVDIIKPSFSSALSKLECWSMTSLSDLVS